jgi:hypothetical protein
MMMGDLARTVHTALATTHTPLDAPANDDAATLARGVRAALDRMATKAAAARR